MMGRWIISALLLPFCVAAAPTTTTSPTAATTAATAPADEKPVTLGEAKAKQQVESLTEVAKLPIINAKKISDVLSITLHDNDLELTTTLKPTDDAVVRVPGLPGLSRMRVMASQLDPTQIVGFDFSNIDYSPPDVVTVQTTVGVAAGQVTIFRAYQHLEDETHTIQLIQHPEPAEGEPKVRLYVQITGPNAVNINRSAASVVELRRQYPGDVSKYVDPIFRTLKQNGFLARIETRLAWQVFADAYQPPAEVVSKVQALVAKLDAQEYRDREDASADLEKLGEPAALIVMRMDRKKLTDEQIGRVDAFLAKFKMVPDADVAHLRKERDFLLDCLNSEDAAIRQAALTELRHQTGKQIPFDLSANEETRLAAIDQLRAQFGAAPTTQTTTTPE
jgi:hypothetical protein